MVASETTPLTGPVQDGKVVKVTLHIEMLRCFGLFAGTLLLATGWFITTFFVVYPEKENPSTPFQKLFGGAPSDFDETKTFIYEMFHFSHTCTLLDFNPSKTVAALVIMVHTIPCNLFVVLHYYRVMAQVGGKWDNLKAACPTMTLIQFITFMYFYMVFVNSPYGHYGDPQASIDFTLHYIPYCLWQMGILFMAIQQCWYTSLKGVVPFGIPPTLVWYYVLLLIAFFFVYSTFVFSFIFDMPLWCTTDECPTGKTAAKCVMYGWDFFAVLIPVVLAYKESQDGNVSVITFHEMTQ